MSSLYKIGLIILCIGHSFLGLAQNNCADNIQVCGNQAISLNVSGGGTQEISNSSWCFSQENNSLWLRFTIETGGTLGFNLIPASTAITEDYDFMVFGPNVSCSSKGSPIRCSSTNPQAANTSNNHTGMKGSSTDVSEGPGWQGDNWVKWLTVTAGQSYFLLIDRPIGNSAFTLNWTGTAKLKKTNAGPDKLVCKGKTATMSATETGTWIQHGSNPKTVNLSSTTSSNAIVSGLTIAGMYNFTWSSLGCADTMKITVLNTSSKSESKSICKGESYNGHNTAGTYRDTFKNANNCDSIVTLNLSIKDTSSSQISKTICQGQSYLGKTITGTYLDKLTNAVGCDSFRTLNLTVNPSHSFTISKGICDGQSFMGKSATGIYTFNYTNRFGCDSVLKLNLNVRDYTNVIVSRSICEGQSVFGYTSSGTYHDTFKSIEGCDSFRTLNLTVHKHTDSTVYDTICEGHSLDGYTSSGIYVDVLRNANNCDSTRTLHLHVKPNSFFTINKTICEGQSYLGRSVAGNYSDVFRSANGCDSTRFLNLDVSKKRIQDTSKIICEGESFMGYTQTGFYRDTLRTNIGCDSVITNLTLTVIPKKWDIDTSICEGDSFLGYKQTGVYIDNVIDNYNCPRIRKLDLEVIPTTYGGEVRVICFGDSYKGKTSTGNYVIHYTNLRGCDSVYTLDLTVKPDFFPKTLRDTNTCIGNPIVLSVPSSFKAYLWNDGIAAFSRNVISTGNYVVTATNHDDCKSTDSAFINFYPLPEVEIGDDRIIYDGEGIDFNPTVSGFKNFNGFHWSPKSLFSCDSCIRQFLRTSSSTFVKLNYTDFNTCSNSDSIQITVLPVENIGFPTAFSPNGDGKNDFFEMNGGPVRSLEISVYNRWGEKVYEYMGRNPKWDGTYKGELLRTGVYTYHVKLYQYNSLIKEHFSTITIIR